MMHKGILNMVQRHLDMTKALAYTHARITTFLHCKIMGTVPVMTPTRLLRVHLLLYLIQNVITLDLMDLAVSSETQFITTEKVMN